MFNCSFLSIRTITTGLVAEVTDWGEGKLPQIILGTALNVVGGLLLGISGSCSSILG